MNKEQRKCQNCHKEFTIEPEDFKFYEKIKVPPPTWCPECRMIRRMVWRNERSLYKRKCDLCKKDIIAMYVPKSTAKIYCHECWYSDKWNRTANGTDYDWHLPFFVQWKRLLENTPLLALNQVKSSIDSEYTNYVADNKHCYLVYSAVDCENVAYSSTVDRDKDCFDCVFLKDSELCYENVDGSNNYASKFLVQSRNCLESAFLFDCVNCSHCFMSSNLRNKRYVLNNVQRSKDEYEKEMSRMDFGSFAIISELWDSFQKLIQQSALHKFAHILNSTGCSGENIENCKNVKAAFGVYDSENIKYASRCAFAKDAMDLYGFGIGNGELGYEATMPGFNAYHVKFIIQGDVQRDVEYSMLNYSSQNLFGCIGLRNKQYCILNKQYTKEEYEELIPKIIKHMDDMPYKDKQGKIYKYGEFFPPELSPFCYNETIAQEYFPLTKDEAEKQGYRWKDPEQRNYQITIKAEDLPDNIKEVKDSITNEIISCEHKGECNEQCTSAFKIIPQELQFYKRMNLPLPRLCPNCRHYSRLKQRNPLKLWKRKCMCGGQKSTNGIYQNTSSHSHGDNPCPNEFQTSYLPEGPETVYCEQCYNSEVV